MSDKAALFEDQVPDRGFETDLSIYSLPMEETGQLNKELVIDQLIKFDSYSEEPLKEEMDNDVPLKFPVDVVEEWPSALNTHFFYFVRHRPYHDVRINEEITLALQQLHEAKLMWFQILGKLREKKASRSKLSQQLSSLNYKNEQYKIILDDKKKEIDPLKVALGKLQNGPNSKRVNLCSSEEDLDNKIKSLQCHMQHNSISLAEEKKILKEIKQLNASRELVINNFALKSKIVQSMGQKEDIEDQVKHMNVDCEGVKKERQAVRKKIGQCIIERTALDKEISSLQYEHKASTEKRDKLLKTINELKNHSVKENASFHEYETLLRKAGDLAQKKDLKLLKELSKAQVAKFMSIWNSSETFRDDYVKRSLGLCDKLQRGVDGRISEDLSYLKHGPPAGGKQGKDVPLLKKIPNEIAVSDSTTYVQHTSISEKKKQLIGIRENQLSQADEENGGAKLRELRWEEEMIKAKQAMVRKNKRTKKAEDKESIWAKKKADKKLKKRQKKLKKKAVAPRSVPPHHDVIAETVVEATTTLVAVKVENVELNSESLLSAKVINVGNEGAASMKHIKQPENWDSIPNNFLRKISNQYRIWYICFALLLLSIVVLVVYCSHLKIQ